MSRSCYGYDNPIDFKLISIQSIPALEFLSNELYVCGPVTESYSPRATQLGATAMMILVFTSCSAIVPDIFGWWVAQMHLLCWWEKSDVGMWRQHLQSVNFRMAVLSR